jgi:hypothetical protein
MQGRLEQLAPATAQKNINLAVLRSLEIPYPDPEYQAEVLAEYDREMSLLGALDGTTDIQDLHARSLRSSILATAFSGELVPQDANDEAASVLLNRIADEGQSSDGQRASDTKQPSTSMPTTTEAELHAIRLGIQLMWEDGYTMAEIADTMDMAPRQLGAEMKRMRVEGWELPYRRRKATA